MAGVSFSGHRLELLAAYEEVIREESAADWALYTYEDGSDDLKLAASGEGGLQELSGHFENQKVMYGFCSVKDSQAALPKYVLINWVGEDVPDARKCACASHVAKVAEFFQGVDVIVNASSVEDIDAGAIGQRLSNGLARLSSPVLHRLRLREDENAEPVGTTYQKTDAAVEMKRINREQFWEQAKKEEELRKEEERKKALDARLRFEQERMEQERQEQEERERRYREREQQIEEHRRKQQSLEAEEAKRRLKEQSIFGDQRDEEEESQMKKSESEVEEAAAIIAQRPDNPREFFRQQERVASASGGSCDAPAPAPFNHRPGRPYCPFIKASDSGPSSSSSSSSSPPRTPFPYITCHRTPNLSSSLPCSHLDSHRRMAPTPIPTRSPSDSSTASTPIAEQIERALDEVTSSQPPPPPPPPPPTQEAQETTPSLDEELSKEAKVTAAPEVWAGCAAEPPQAQEPPLLQSSPLEDSMCTESPEQAALAAPAEPAASVTSVADVHAADTIETTTATTDTTIANNVTPAAASLIDLWPGNGEEASTLQAEPRVPTPPSGAEASLAEVPLLNEAAQEPLPPVGEGCANLLNFDELPEPPATFCDPEEEVGETLAASQVLTMPSALEEVDQVLEQELEPEPHLLTNGETTQKEGTQASEGYFSQSQEEEFAQSEEPCAKVPPPVFYNKPPEIDITCWDADPVPEEEEGFEGGD
ncbi:drebrin isoform 6 [Mus musculus]|uniref:Drebrin n=2 Tax=Mus musculus TaxID=10090 RepID=DREB_MOUSE|nr:drebrin isoform 1 [Mus musculus]NP_001413607.1 drebrin isoform 6 [Mus musculus]Q9QXS6.4 RecName: Full=Drebrin; AltName: Full=Developmentally-regulated brain protein [Mus musculus]|eukprot:NP_001170842.1 drebrin isoform 1 [Mus musculus]